MKKNIFYSVALFCAFILFSCNTSNDTKDVLIKSEEVINAGALHNELLDMLANSKENFFSTIKTRSGGEAQVVVNLSKMIDVMSEHPLVKKEITPEIKQNIIEEFSKINYVGHKNIYEALREEIHNITGEDFDKLLNKRTRSANYSKELEDAFDVYDASGAYWNNKLTRADKPSKEIIQKIDAAGTYWGTAVVKTKYLDKLCGAAFSKWAENINEVCEQIGDIWKLNPKFI